MDGEPQLKPLKFSVECGRLHAGCGMKLTGSYEEVLEGCVAHARRAHGRDDEAALREAIKPLIRQEAIEWLWPSAELNDRRRAADWPR